MASSPDLAADALAQLEIAEHLGPHEKQCVRLAVADVEKAVDELGLFEPATFRTAAGSGAKVREAIGFRRHCHDARVFEKCEWMRAPKTFVERSEQITGPVLSSMHPA